MLKNISISIILLHFTSIIFAQHKTDSLLFCLEKQVFESTNDTAKAELILKKTALYITEGKFDSLFLQETDRLEWKLLKDTILCKNFLWNASLLNMLNKRYVKAENYFNQYQLLNKNDSSLNAKLLAGLIFMNIDSTKLKKIIIDFGDSLLNDLKCYQNVIEYHKKAKVAYILSSAIFPGSGMLELRKPKQGLTSLVLNTATVFTIYSLIQANLYFNAITWGILLGQKFYLGGLALTQKIFDENESKTRYELSQHCEKRLIELLKKHPLTYK